MKKSILKVVQHDLEQDAAPAVEVCGFHAWHEDAHILNDINLAFQEYKINCVLGPSGGGKSTLIRCINRINDEIEGFTFKGEIHFGGRNIYDKSVDVTRLRTEIGMVFQKPSVFPKSICENVLFGIQHLKKLSKAARLQMLEEKLKAVSLWREVSHRLNDTASSLSVGQQQRLCIARTLAVEPKVILLDEPTSSLDPVSARAIEDLMLELKQQYTIVFVTHNIQQAKRIADHAIFVCGGRIIEQGPARRFFTHPEQPQTKSYLNEEFCDC